MTQTLPSISAILLLIAVRMAYPGMSYALEPISYAAAQLTFNQIVHDERTDRLQSYLIAHDSPLADESAHFISEADRLGLDWKLVAAIAGTESTFGKHIPSGSHNAWGWGIPTGTQSGKAFGSWKEGITTISEGLKTRYMNRGAVSVEQIGKIYATSPRWAENVRFFIDQINSFTPDDPDLLEITL